jgi:hypothetical protein
MKKHLLLSLDEEMHASFKLVCMANRQTMLGALREFIAGYTEGMTPDVPVGVPDIDILYASLDELVSHSQLQRKARR